MQFHRSFKKNTRPHGRFLAFGHCALEALRQSKHLAFQQSALYSVQISLSLIIGFEAFRPWKHVEAVKISLSISIGFEAFRQWRHVEALEVSHHIHSHESSRGFSSMGFKREFHQFHEHSTSTGAKLNHHRTTINQRQTFQRALHTPSNSRPARSQWPPAWHALLGHCWHFRCDIFS